MKQEIITKAMSEIFSRKHKAEREYQKKMQPLFDDQQFCTLNKQLARLQIEKAKSEAYGKKSDTKQIKMLEAQIEAIKAKHNLQNLEVAYSCRLCKDEGFKNGQMCICLKKEISKQLLAGSGFEKLEDFSKSTETAGNLAPVFKKMQQWCQSDFKKNLVYLAGPTGVGKTHLLRCMANELISRGKIVKIVTAYSINQDFKTFSKTYDEEILNKYTQCEVLFIDDLGTEPLYRNVTLEYFYLVINERKMKHLPTIITSNLDLDDLQNRYEERITSRIADRETSITLYLSGEDRRLSKK